MTLHSNLIALNLGFSNNNFGSNMENLTIL